MCAATKISLCFVLLVVTVPLYSAWPKQADVDTVTVCFKKACVQAEVADTNGARARGLMFRKKLLLTQGMLFIFPSDDRHTFWMKNMRFPIDIIWIDRDKTIVDIKAGVVPCTATRCQSFIPKALARYVVEVAAGFTQKNRIKVGDRIEFILP
jgi:hypothetical protein